MLFGLQHTIINFNNIYSSNITVIPTICIQPILHIPTFAPTIRDPERVLWGTSLMGKPYFKHLSIAFAVDYHISGENCNEKINELYDLENTVIYLEKYEMNQSKDEANAENLSKFENVFSSETFKQKNIDLFISPTVFDVNHGRLKSGCQIIYLASEYGIQVASALKRYISNFKKLFRATRKNDNYVYRFKVVVKTKNGNASFSESIELYTNLFMLIFDENDHTTSLEYAQLEDYLVCEAI